MDAADHSTQPCTQANEALPARRNVLLWLSLTLGSLAAALAGMPIVGYLLGAVIKPRRDEWIDLGPASIFPRGQIRLVNFVNPHKQPWDGQTGKSAAYVRHDSEGKFTVFAVNCAHLGCPVSWFPQSGLFLCPCHGGVYYENGDRASGPPPRGLYAYEHKIEDDRLLILAGHLPTLQDTLKDRPPVKKNV